MNPTAFEQFETLEATHWWFRGRRRVYLEILRSVIGDSKPARCLDVGAGVGGFLGELEQLSGVVFHTEIEMDALKTCRRRGHLRGLTASATHLPFHDQSFDLVCMFDVIEHIHDDSLALAEAQRVLAPGGYLLLSVPAHPWLFSNNDRVAGHRRRYSRSALLQLFERSQLSIRRCTFTNMLLFPIIAGFLMAAKALESTELTNIERQTTNLSWKLPVFVNSAMYLGFCTELVLSRRYNLPLGHSLLLVACAPK
ncbi:MAG: ubiquinone/menaquinone biosynthesis C-methylase UbiE [Planctomycetota bacterium]|jgi:ubiquinone/menaquinone biosynthesis C-methylase UbiE